jgi:tRNA-(MS[2]IO[6]A)-hydroxylase (MiaE)-like
VVNWFRRRSARVEAPKLRPRSESAATTKVDLAELTPEPEVLLGEAAYLQLTIFENLSRAVATAPSIESKAALSTAASRSLQKYEGLVAEIERGGRTAAALMEPHRARIDAFQRVTLGADWSENLVTCYVAAGFLDDFFIRLAAGMHGDAAGRVIAVLSKESGEKLLVRELAAQIDANPRLASRLAMWGRRLVGDTMLVARGALHHTDNPDSDEARLEPVFTELIASHTRRMDALGLTA